MRCGRGRAKVRGRVSGHEWPESAWVSGSRWAHDGCAATKESKRACHDKKRAKRATRVKGAAWVGVSRHRWAKRERGAWVYTARRGCVVMEWHNTPSGEHEQGVRVRNNTPYLGGVFAGVNADL